MNKSLCVVMFLIMLCACGKETVVPGSIPIVPGDSELEKVQFSVGSISPGRAVEMNNENFATDGRRVGVLSYKHAGELEIGMDAQYIRTFPLTYKGGSWNYTPYMYWPNKSDTLYSFVGICPYMSDYSEQLSYNVEDESLSINYNLGNNVSNQVDMLYAVAKNCSVEGGIVELNFKHALSKVSFSVAGTFSGTGIDSVCITDMRLKGVAQSGTFVVLSDFSGIEWSTSETTDIPILNIAHKLSTTSAQLGDYLYLIPQNLEISPITIDLVYDVYSNSTGVPQKKQSTFELPTSIVNKWSENRSYNYALSLNLSEINFGVEVSIAEFENDSSVDLDVPSPGVVLPETGDLNVIYYRTIDGEIIEPLVDYSGDADWGGAQIVSNTYENGYGKIVFDDVVTRIPNSAFYSGDWDNNSTLSEIILPKSITEIGNGAFERCVYLTDITIPDSVTRIGAFAFNDCAGLTSVYIPKSVTYIDKKAFFFWEYRRNIESIIVHEDNLVYDSRDNCNAIIETQTNKMLVACNTTIIPNEIVTIGYNAFSRCNLSECVLPNSVELIDTNAFIFSEISEIVLSESLVSIYSDAFTGCHLSEVVIPCSVEYIGRAAFNSVDILSLESTTPCRVEYDFMTKSYTIINVPEGAIDNYANADGWVAYRHMINGFVEPEINLVNEIVDSIQIVYDAMGYTGTTYSFAIEEIYNAFGVGEESLQKEIEAGRFDYYAEDSEGTLHQANGNTEFSSWWGDNGKVTNWGADAKIFFEGETPNVCTVGQYPGHCEIGTVYPTSHLFTYFSNGETKAIRLKVDVEIVASK